MVIAASQQRLPGRRAQRGDMEPVIGQPAGRQPVSSRRRRRPAERAHRAIASIIQQDQQHIRRVRRRAQRPDRRELRLRVPRISLGLARSRR